MKRGQYTYDQVVNQLKYEMSQNSSYENRKSLAIRFSDFIYNERWHNLCLDNQIFCAEKIIELFNIEPAEAIGLQQTIVRGYQIADDMLVVNELIQQHHITVTNIINSNLQSNNKTHPKIEPPQIQQTPKEYKGVEKIEGNTQQIIEYMNVEAGKCWGSNALRDTKVINLTNTYTTGQELENLAYTMRQFNFNLQAFSVGNNNLGDYAIGALMNGVTSTNMQTLYSAESGWKPYIASIPVTQSMVYLNLSNTNMGDGGAKYISDVLASGKLSDTKHIDISENNFTLSGEKFIVNALQQEIVQDMLVTLKRSYNIKTMISGNKEQKQFLIRETLQNAQDEGVDVRNVGVSKSMYDKVLNIVKVGRDFSWGFGKCYIVPEDIQTFAGERIIAKASKKTSSVNNAKDAVICFFDTIDEVLTSNEGVQLIKDLDLYDVNSVIDSVE